MRRSNSQRRYPFPSSSNDVHKRNEQYPYVDEEHMRAFEEALMADDRSIVDYPASSPSVPGSPVVPQQSGTARIRKVSAMSDFAPVNIRVKRSVPTVRESLCGPHITN
ncbi:hypothetical protein BC826DRAFT_198851 [Russula brevipes]|nr:hypothetical protein BC826DRAFT_198851 [Russula brevipes]